MSGRPKVVSTTQAGPVDAAPPSAQEYDFVEVYAGAGNRANLVPETGAEKAPRAEPAAQKPGGFFSSIRKFLGF
ncbi:MAG: hypothetical protein WC792_05795 [Candidatus Micrarchaeia archaeon]|jgi:hypothetical protein